ncbi:hypothetical protein ACWJJH_08955 [Endozoicomonadaceae bacterium StTr2]
MKNPVLLSALTIMVSLAIWQSGKEPETPIYISTQSDSPQDIQISQESKKQQRMLTVEATAIEASSSSESPEQPPLAVYQGQKLITAIEAFWVQCRQQSNCAEALDKLKTDLSDARYSLISEYPELSATWQEVLGNLLLDEQGSLEQKVSEFKRRAREIWGDLADVVLADEFALYDFSLESQQLADNNPDNYIEEYQQLLTRWQSHSGALSLDSNAAIYEKGVNLIPISYTKAQRNQVISQLARHYLTEQQSMAISRRGQQVATQQAQVADYQTQLLQLKAALSQQKATTHADMPDTEWQQYAEQKISEFRINFFQHQ